MFEENWEYNEEERCFEYIMEFDPELTLGECEDDMIDEITQAVLAGNWSYEKLDD